MFHKLTVALAIAVTLFACAGPQAVAQEQPPTSDATFIAKAQPAPAMPTAIVVPGMDLSGPANTIINSVALGLAGILTAVLAWIGQGVVGLLGAKKSSEQSKARADDIRAKIDDVSHDLKMNELSNQVAQEVVDYAINISGIKIEDLKDIKIRNPTLRLAAKFGAVQWVDLWKWVDQDENGQMDWLESKLKKVLPPVDPASVMRAAPPPAE